MAFLKVSTTLTVGNYTFLIVLMVCSSYRWDFEALFCLSALLLAPCFSGVVPRSLCVLLEILDYLHSTLLVRLISLNLLMEITPLVLLNPLLAAEFVVFAECSSVDFR